MSDDRTHADVIRPALVYTNTLYPDALAALDALLADLAAATERAERAERGISTEHLCVCGHSTYWHSDGGSRDCEFGPECPCSRFTPVTRAESTDDWLVHRLEVAEAQLVAAREALAHYADPNNWNEDEWGDVCIFEADAKEGGKRARAALAASGTPPERETL